jgi:hypothetical protein
MFLDTKVRIEFDGIVFRVPNLKSFAACLKPAVAFSLNSTRTDENGVHSQCNIYRSWYRLQEKALTSIRDAVAQLEQNAAALESEVGSDLLGQLSREETAELQSLNPEVTDLKQQLVEIRKKRMEVSFHLCTRDTPDFLG